MTTARQVQLWFWWVVATTGGWGITHLFWFVIFSILSTRFGMPPGQGIGLPLGLLIPVTQALGIGVAQWLVLHTLVRNPYGWIPTNVLSTVTYIPLGLTFANGNGAVAGDWGLLGALTGVIVATAQWAVLSNQVREAHWWVPASAAGWGLGWFIGASIAENSTITGMARTSVAFTLGWACTATFTGIALAWLLRDRLGDAR